jgi:beta-1,4-N-acetylglucosaminyltransferase
MIFLTVGTQFAFDRLVQSFDEIVGHGQINDEVYAQIGQSSYEPRNFKAVESMENGLFNDYMRNASYIISHAGMGTITMAMDHKKPILVMPRRKKYGEVVNDHQLAIAKKFEQSGHLIVAYKQEDLAVKFEKLKCFTPVPRKPDTEAVIKKISEYLVSIKK